ncbi:MAG: hypothetical protein IKG88_00645, partial [Bacteroidales bacterium]|nr:hypothetical protein [Bacteroidales bacterium]
ERRGDNSRAAGAPDERHGVHGLFRGEEGVQCGSKEQQRPLGEGDRRRYVLRRRHGDAGGGA